MHPSKIMMICLTITKLSFLFFFLALLTSYLRLKAYFAESSDPTSISSLLIFPVLPNSLLTCPFGPVISLFKSYYGFLNQILISQEGP